MSSHLQTRLSNSDSKLDISNRVGKFGSTFLLLGSLLFMPLDHGNLQRIAFAEVTDMASTTVENAIRSLKDTIGDDAATFKSLENIGDIIVEGRGVGGSLSYSGVKLERGYVANEDTSIYNPGLSLLTESEKARLVNAVIENRKENVLKSSWSEKNELAFNFLKQKLDPWHIVELRGFLEILPFYGALLYLAALGVQQNKQDWFPAFYVLSAGAFFIPIVGLLVSSP